MLQYSITSSNSSINNSQKLYLPTGWNHTSRRGPLYATSVIVIASLLTAIAVLSTVVGVVARRRATRRRRIQLKNNHPYHSTNHSNNSSSPRDIELGDLNSPSQINRMKHRLKTKLKRLTIIKINNLSKGRKQANITRIPIIIQPNDPPPPSVILVDQAQRPISFTSQCRFYPNGTRQNRSRKTYLRSLGSQSQNLDSTHELRSNHHPKDFVTRSPSGAQIPIPSSTAPVIDSTQNIINSEILLPHPTTSHHRDPLQADLSQRHLPASSSNPFNIPLNSGPQPINHSTTNGQFESITGSIHTPSRHDIHTGPADTPYKSTQNLQHSNRINLEPNGGLPHRLFTQRSNTTSGSQTTHHPIASSSSASLPSISPTLENPIHHSLTPSHRITPKPSQHLLSPPGPSVVQTIVMSNEQDVNHHVNTIDEPTLSSIGIENRRQSDSLPPAYSSQTAPAEGSRAAEKRRLVNFYPEGEEGNITPVENQSKEGNHYEEQYAVPIVAHIATDDKSILKNILDMGSTPAKTVNVSIGENDSRMMDDHVQIQTLRGSEWMNKSNERYDEVISHIPSAPPFLYEDEECERVEFALDRRRLSLMNTTQDEMTNLKQDKIDVRENFGLLKPLNDDQIGKSFRDLNILPLPPDRLTIRFNPNNFEESNAPTVKNPAANASDASSSNQDYTQPSSVMNTDLEKNYYSPSLEIQKGNLISSENNLPSAPPTTYSSSLTQQHDCNHSDQDETLNSSSTCSNMITTHDLILPSAPPLLDDDDSPLTFEHFVPPYAE